MGQVPGNSAVTCFSLSAVTVRRGTVTVIVITRILDLCAGGGSGPPGNAYGVTRILEKRCTNLAARY